MPIKDDPEQNHARDVFENQLHQRQRRFGDMGSFIGLSYTYKNAHGELETFLSNMLNWECYHPLFLSDIFFYVGLLLSCQPPASPFACCMPSWFKRRGGPRLSSAHGRFDLYMVKRYDVKYILRLRKLLLLRSKKSVYIGVVGGCLGQSLHFASTDRKPQTNPLFVDNPLLFIFDGRLNRNAWTTDECEALLLTPKPFLGFGRRKNVAFNQLTGAPKRPAWRLKGRLQY